MSISSISNSLPPVPIQQSNPAVARKDNDGDNDATESKAAAAAETNSLVQSASGGGNLGTKLNILA